MTVLFSFKSIYKSYGDDTLFEDLSFDFKNKERLGLIGINGSGKSTFLKLIAKLSQPDDGDIVSKNNINYVYLSQKDNFDPELTIEQTLFKGLSNKVIDEKERHRIIQKSLGTGSFENPETKIKYLSGGWKKRLAIVRALSLKPDILLLDEPTNHLDMNGILWLEKILNNPGFSYIVVSHDRSFLENVCLNIMEIGRCYPKGFFKLQGNYSFFIKERKKFLIAQQKQENSLASKMRREDEWLKQGPKARSTKAKYRIDQAQKLRMDLYSVKERNLKTATLNLNFHSTGRKTKKLLTALNLSKSYDNKVLFENISFELVPGSCLGIIGENGSGKSTFLSILKKKIKPDSGKVHLAEDLVISTFDQGKDNLDPQLPLKRALNPMGGDSVNYKNHTIHIVTWAKRFLFMPDQLDMPVKNLSGGEKARILIANLMLKPCDILLLDEPTNDLDILSLEVLEESLKEFSGAIVIVSHDRFLMNNITNNLLYLDAKRGSQFFKNYNQILDFRKQYDQKNHKIKNIDKPKKYKKKPVKINFSYKEKYELENIEEKILNAENQVLEYQNKIQDPQTIEDPSAMANFCSKLSNAEQLVESLYIRWEELEKKSQLT